MNVCSYDCVLVGLCFQCIDSDNKPCTSVIVQRSGLKCDFSWFLSNDSIHMEMYVSLFCVIIWTVSVLSCGS